MVVAGGLWLCWVPAALLLVPLGSLSYLCIREAVSHPQTPQRRLTLPSHGDETHTQAPPFLP